MKIRNRFNAEVRAAVGSALAELGWQDEEFQTEASDMADLAVPCFAMAKTRRLPPKEIAARIADKVTVGGTVAAVEAVNGYLNFTIDPAMLVESTLTEIVERGDDYGSLPAKGIKINVEHTSTNPTGPIHVGRARNPIIGDTLSRCLARCGYEVETEYYVNDVGKQVVILTWGIDNIPDGEVERKEERDKPDHRLVANYRHANRMMEEDEDVRERISEMLRRFEAGDAEVIGSVRRTTELMLDGLKETLSEINVVLDRYTWESDFIADGSARDVVERLKTSEYAGQADDGAWYLDLESFGIRGKNTKFTFTRSDGTTLYTTRDLAYHLDKFRRADEAVNVLGEDQKLGSKQLCSALQILGSEKMPDPMFYSFVSLPEGKMSTRRGVVVYLDDLIDEAVSRAYDEIRKRRSDLPEERMRGIARQIGIGAIRYNIVRVSPDKQLVFRWEDALNFDGNSGPYLQYVHARACSMLRKAGEYNYDCDPGMLTDEYEIRLVRALAGFEEALYRAGEQRKVNTIPAYGHEVASAFNQFYAAVPVLAAGENRDARLTLVECTRTVLKNVLDCLGMEAPEEM